mgnify:FL=1
MTVTHQDGIDLEYIVCDAYDKQEFQMGGINNADVYERYPYLAAVICISRLITKQNEHVADHFVNTWKTVFEYPDENHEYTFEQYAKELRELVNKLK